MKIKTDEYSFVFCAGNNQTQICTVVITTIDDEVKGCSIFTIGPCEDQPRLSAHYNSIPDFIRTENAITHKMNYIQT